ncbi:helix-turn-helix domain-containing protein [Labrenzia sp. PHM005]|uniref:helix-turn-helix domain-containing protein n=1 Tax=Labrenzia sp. PHM005 TaxID=2590016 RepID=UPI001140052F|nr:AraC family transcriptional regulator [Labrenzia sp. PHM005]QDG77061.1 helix-turn-helix transcriptional regulator [Labrenzia sp. PHM005]
MIQTRSFLSHPPDDVLTLPEDLHAFQEASVVMAHGEAGIFHKLIEKTMLAVEFRTAAPCLCMTLRGRETFWTSDGREISLQGGEMILMPANTYMISDFSAKEGPLEAYILSFDTAAIRALQGPHPQSGATGAASAYKIQAHAALAGFFDSAKTIYGQMTGSPSLLQTKLLECLHLIAEVDDAERLTGFLTACHTGQAPRNILHVMRENARRNLSVAELARMSGRSVTSFTRDFKRQFGMPPRQWLADYKLQKAQELVLNSRQSVTEIGAELGYSSTSHFIEKFRKQFGTTPKAMRLRSL